MLAAAVVLVSARTLVVVSAAAVALVSAALVVSAVALVSAALVSAAAGAAGAAGRFAAGLPHQPLNSSWTLSGATASYCAILQRRVLTTALSVTESIFLL